MPDTCQTLQQNYQTRSRLLIADDGGGREQHSSRTKDSWRHKEMEACVRELPGRSRRQRCFHLQGCRLPKSGQLLGANLQEGFVIEDPERREVPISQAHQVSHLGA